MKPKNCPFCGSIPIGIEKFSGGVLKMSYFKCNNENCGQYYSDYMHIDKWNRRYNG